MDKYPILVPGDLFVMRWTKEQPPPPTVYLVLKDLSKDHSDGALSDVHQEILGFASDLGAEEPLIVYRSDYDEGTLKIVSRR